MTPEDAKKSKNSRPCFKIYWTNLVEARWTAHMIIFLFANSKHYSTRNPLRCSISSFKMDLISHKIIKMQGPLDVNLRVPIALIIMLKCHYALYLKFSPQPGAIQILMKQRNANPASYDCFQLFIPSQWELLRKLLDMNWQSTNTTYSRSEI